MQNRIELSEEFADRIISSINDYNSDSDVRLSSPGKVLLVAVLLLINISAGIYIGSQSANHSWSKSRITKTEILKELKEVHYLSPVNGWDIILRSSN